MHPRTDIAVQTHMQAACSGTSGMKPVLQRVASDFHFLFHMWGMNGLTDSTDRQPEWLSNCRIL